MVKIYEVMFPALVATNIDLNIMKSYDFVAQCQFVWPLRTCILFVIVYNWTSLRAQSEVLLFWSPRKSVYQMD